MDLVSRKRPDRDSVPDLSLKTVLLGSWFCRNGKGRCLVVPLFNCADLGRLIIIHAADNFIIGPLLDSLAFLQFFRTEPINCFGRLFDDNRRFNVNGCVWFLFFCFVRVRIGSLLEGDKEVDVSVETEAESIRDQGSVVLEYQLLLFNCSCQNRVVEGLRCFLLLLCSLVGDSLRCSAVLGLDGLNRILICPLVESSSPNLFDLHDDSIELHPLQLRYLFSQHLSEDLRSSLSQYAVWRVGEQPGRGGLGLR